MKISWVRMTSTNDTMNAGITTHAVNDPNYKSSKLFRFASLGEPVYFFDNSFSQSDRMMKTQTIFNQQLKAERELNYSKDGGNEFDTAYHMNSFTLTKYYPDASKPSFAIADLYQGSLFSVKPTVPSFATETTTYNSDGTIKWKRTKYKTAPDNSDSTTYTYPDKNTSIEKYFRSEQLLWTVTTKYDASTHQLLSETTEAKDDEGKPYSYTVNYTYDTQHRLISVSNTLSKDRSNVRYNENGLPELVTVYTNGQMQAVVFYYSFYQ